MVRRSSTGFTTQGSEGVDVVRVISVMAIRMDRSSTGFTTSTCLRRRAVISKSPCRKFRGSSLFIAWAASEQICGWKSGRNYIAWRASRPSLREYIQITPSNQAAKPTCTIEVKRTGTKAIKPTATRSTRSFHLLGDLLRYHL